MAQVHNLYGNVVRIFCFSFDFVDSLLDKFTQSSLINWQLVRNWRHDSY